MTEYTLMQSKPYDGTEEQTLETIRAILTEAQTPELPPAKPKSAAKAFVDRTLNTAQAPRRRATDLPDLRDAPPPVDRPGLRTRLAERGRAWVRPLLEFRPTARQLALASLALLMLARPMWFVTCALIVFVLTTAIFLFFGADRVWHRVIRVLERIERRNPARGARLRQRLDRFAMRWDGILDKLPDGIADDLYMPDLQEHNREKVAEMERRYADRLHRLANAEA